MTGSTTKAGASTPQPANRILAIDGPAGAGKSTVAVRMAQRFGLLNLETGAMYRAFAFKALRAGIGLEDIDTLTALSHETSIRLEPGVEGNRVLLDGEDVTPSLRTPDVTEAASRVSVHGPVRAWLVSLQQAMGLAVPSGIVMEGRDIGTVVFPQASIKVFLEASPEARAERRLLQNEAQPNPSTTDPSTLLAAIRERDNRDRSRAESPLRAAEDAIHIDSTTLPLEAVIAQITTLVEERWGS